MVVLVKGRWKSSGGSGGESMGGRAWSRLFGGCGQGELNPLNLALNDFKPPL